MRPLLILGLLTLFSCSTDDLKIVLPSTYFPDEADGDPVNILPNTTPENVLENLKTAYNRRRFELYKSLLSPDFRFYMSESYRNIIIDPGGWTATFIDSTLYYYKTREQDLAVMRNMLDPAGPAKTIALSFSPLNMNHPDTDTAYYQIHDIRLTVTLRSPPITYTAANNPLKPTQVFLARTETGLWEMTEWWDNTQGSDDRN